MILECGGDVMKGLVCRSIARVGTLASLSPASMAGRVKLDSDGRPWESWVGVGDAMFA